MRCPDCEGWITIEDFTDDTAFERLHCAIASRERRDTAITRGRHRVLLAKERHAAIGKSIRRRKVRTTGMKIGAQA
jgi:hypothetical protein